MSHHPVSIDPPVVIAGIGGSGTRVFARILRLSGRFMGTNVNESEDALEFYDFATRWIGRYWTALTRGVPLEDSEHMRAEFEEAVGRHRAGMKDAVASWGWKQPRSIYFVPFLRGLYPALRLIHVVRDGRDVSFGPAALRQVRDTAPAVLGSHGNSEPVELRMMRLWSHINTVAADYGKSEMGDNYLRVRFEDLCQSPAETIRRLLDFSKGAGTGLDPTPEMLAEVAPPARSIDRWHREDPRAVAEVTRIGKAALERFGYPDASELRETGSRKPSARRVAQQRGPLASWKRRKLRGRSPKPGRSRMRFWP